MTVSNAFLGSTGLTIGSSSYNNTVTVQGDVAWNFGGGALQIGSGTGLHRGHNNVFNVTGATAGFTNLGGVLSTTPMPACCSPTRTSRRSSAR